MLAQRNQLENERKQFTEAAIRLGKERALLEREKEDVEELRRAMDTQSLLKELPSTPGYARGLLYAGLYNTRTIFAAIYSWLKHQRPGMTPVRKPTTTAELSTPAALATITNTVLNHPHATGAGGGTPARRSAALLMSTPTGSALKPALRSRATAAADEIGKMTPGGAALSSVYFTPSTPYQGHGGAAPAVAPSSTGSSGKKEVRFVNTGEIDPRGVDAFENWENVRRQADAV